MPARDTIRRHSLPIYFALVFVISWGGGLLVVGPGALPLDASRFDSFGPLLYLAIIAGPAVAGILMTALVDGRPGLRELLAGAQRWRFGPTTYLIALVPAMAVAASALLLAFVSAELRPAILGSNDKGGVLLRALGPSLLVGACEEIGWTGFAVPRLRARHSILSTGLMVGIAWGAWHFPLFCGPDSFSGTLPLMLLLTRLFSWLPAFRLLLIGMHDHTRSLPVVMLMHAAVSFVSIALAPHTLTGARLFTSVLTTATTMWLLVAAFRLMTRRPLSRPPLNEPIARHGAAPG